MIILNKALLERQDVSKESEETIIFLHEIKDYIFDKMSKTNNKIELKELVSFLEEIEYAMQEGWKFSIDSNYHTWWRSHHKCSCPVLDNIDGWGHHKVIGGGCILHG